MGRYRKPLGRTKNSLLLRRDAASKAVFGPYAVGEDGRTVELARKPEKGRIEACFPADHFVCSLMTEIAAYASKSEQEATASHISLCDPQTVIADIDEILALRQENESLRKAVVELEKTIDKLESEAGHA